MKRSERRALGVIAAAAAWAALTASCAEAPLGSSAPAATGQSAKAVTAAALTAKDDFYPQDLLFGWRESTCLPVLQNDIGPNGMDATGLSIARVTQPAHGVVFIQRSNAAALFPVPDCITYLQFDSAVAGSTDTFQYFLDDPGNPNPPSATVTITILPVPAFVTGPVAYDDVATVEPGATVDIPVMANDTNITPRGTPSWSQVSTAAPIYPPEENARIQIIAPDPVVNATANPPLYDVLRYTAPAGFVGRRYFIYSLDQCDMTEGSLLCVQSNLWAAVAVDVKPRSLPPVTQPDAYSTPASTALVVAAPGVLANDSDPNGGALTASVVATPSHGNLALAADGSFRYDPTPGFRGTDTFTYAAHGPGGATNATVTIEVLNRPPVCTGATATAAAAAAGHGYVTATLSGVTDPDADPVTISIDRIWQDQPTRRGDDDDDEHCRVASGLGTATATVYAGHEEHAAGRIYEIYFTARDDHGGSCTGVVGLCTPGRAEGEDDDSHCDDSRTASAPAATAGTKGGSSLVCLAVPEREGDDDRHVHDGHSCHDRRHAHEDGRGGHDGRSCGDRNHKHREADVGGHSGRACNDRSHWHQDARGGHDGRRCGDRSHRHFDDRRGGHDGRSCARSSHWHYDERGGHDGERCGDRSHRHYDTHDDRDDDDGAAICACVDTGARYDATVCGGPRLN